jgi:hypothetical protein
MTSYRYLPLVGIITTARIAYHLYNTAQLY